MKGLFQSSVKGNSNPKCKGCAETSCKRTGGTHHLQCNSKYKFRNVMVNKYRSVRESKITF